MPSYATTSTALPQVFNEGARLGNSLSIVGDSTEETRSHQEIVEFAELRAGGLAEKGIRPGDRVALFAQTSFDFMADLLAVWRLGAVGVPLPIPPRFLAPDAWMDQAVRRISDANAACVLLGAGDPEPLGVRPIWAVDLEDAGAYDGPLPAGEDVALIQFSSGSTSQPKGVVLNHRAVLTQIALAEEQRLLAGDGSRLGWVPLYHDLGLMGFMLPALGSGSTLTMMLTETFLTDPLRWLQEIANRGVQTSAAPTFGYALAARALERTDEMLDLSSWKQAYVGAEPVDLRTTDRFLRAATKHGFDERSFIPCYGLAEAGCGVTSCGPQQGLQIDTVDRAALASGEAKPVPDDHPGVARFVSSGKPLVDFEVIVVDAADRELSERSVGEILVRGSAVMDEYLLDAEASRATLAGGWLHTGDRGYLVGGELFVTGRIKDVIIVRGQNYYAEDIEQVVLAIPDVRPGGCASIGLAHEGARPLVVIAESDAAGDPVRSADVRDRIVRRIWSEVGLRTKEVVLLPPRSLPKTSSGKLQRGLAKQMYLDGAWSDQ